MTKHFTIILSGLVLSAGAAIFTSCGNNSSKDRIDETLKLYHQARSAEDYGTAIVALNKLLLIDSANRKTYTDSLMNHYFFVGNLKSCEKYTEQALKLNPSSVRARELSAEIKLTDPEKIESALNKFQELYAETKDYTYLYNIASIRFSQRDFRSADSLVNTVLEANPIPQGPVRIINRQTLETYVSNTENAFMYLRAVSMANQGMLLGKIEMIREARNICTGLLKKDENFSIAGMLINQIDSQIGGGN